MEQQQLTNILSQLQTMQETSTQIRETNRQIREANRQIREANMQTFLQEFKARLAVLEQVALTWRFFWKIFCVAQVDAPIAQGAVHQRTSWKATGAKAALLGLGQLFAGAAFAAKFKAGMKSAECPFHQKIIMSA